jgi:hypothetical protein
MHPDAALRQYVEAIEQGDIDAAYDLLSASQQHRTSREEFRQLAQDYPVELEAQARELRRQMVEPVPVVADIQLQSGEVATFALEGGRWRVIEGAAGSVSLSSPLQAVRAIRRALLRRSYRGAIRVLARESRAQIEDEISRITEGLEDEESLSIEVNGTRARIIYDDNHFVDLVREDGEWVITDLN